MLVDNVNSVSVKRVMVATDRSKTADRAVGWATRLAAAHQAELLLLQVLAAPGDDAAVAGATTDLQRFAVGLAGARGLARVVVDDDPAQAILDAAENEHVDVVVVGNVGMGGRKQFLLGNIPNRISHNARCSVVIVNTLRPEGQPTSAGSTSRRRSDTSSELEEGQMLRRAWRIGWILARTGAGALQSKSKDADESRTRLAARRFRDALDQLGPTFAKLGQILSTRPDLLPPSFVEELATLQERVTPLTEAEVVAVMERELGVPWEDVFASIEPVPLAAGTIAQVHRATLENGDRVVVKVQRPTAEQAIQQDLALLELFGQKAGARPAFRRAIDLPAMIDHLSSSLRKELDFGNEAANMKRMGEVLAPFSRLDVPAVYQDYSTARLLVMQEIQGGPVRNAPPGAARQEAARQLLEAYYHQVMVEGFFHADPHPGNLKWWNDKIYLLDLGMAGEVDAKVRQMVLLLMLAFAQQDASFLTEVVLALAGGAHDGAAIDVPAFREAVQGIVERYRHLSLKEIQLGPLLQEITQISARHRVPVPASLALMGKAFAQMQLVAAELDPTLDPFAVAEAFVLRNTLRQLGGNLDPKRLFYEAQKIQLRVGRVVEGIEGALGARPGANLQVQFRGLDRLEASIDQASRRLSFAFGLCGALTLTAVTANRPGVPRWVPAVMGGIGTALAAGLLANRPGRGS